jgi:Sulfate permease and related transporters (MFS superfamily)
MIRSAPSLVLVLVRFSWDQSKHVTANRETAEDGDGNLTVVSYEIEGPLHASLFSPKAGRTAAGKARAPAGTLFFASVKTFLDLFDTASDPADVRICLQRARIADYSALEALNTISARYRGRGGEWHF